MPILAAGSCADGKLKATNHEGLGFGVLGFGSWVWAREPEAHGALAPRRPKKPEDAYIKPCGALRLRV